MTPPRNRGTTTWRIGSTAIISIADSWSVARINPSSEASAVPARPGEQQRRDHRTQLSHQTDRGRAAERLLRAEPLQELKPLKSQHHADEQSRQHDDDERQRTGVEDLARDQIESQQRARRNDDEAQ